MTDDPKKPFGVPPTSPVQPGQPSQGGFGQQQPPAQQPQQPGFGQPQQPGFGQPQQPQQPGQPQQPAAQPGQPKQPWEPQQPAAAQPQQPRQPWEPAQPGAFGGPPAGHQQQGGFGMPGQPGQAGFGPPSHNGGPAELPTGLKITSMVLLGLGSGLTVVGLVPCLGILNWAAFPLDMAMCIVGILGLVIGPKLGDGKPANMNLHIAAIIVGVILGAVSFFRCIAGGGIA